MKTKIERKRMKKKENDLIYIDKKIFLFLFDEHLIN